MSGSSIGWKSHTTHCAILLIIRHNILYHHSNMTPSTRTRINHVEHTTLYTQQLHQVPPPSPSFLPSSSVIPVLGKDVVKSS